MKRLYTELLETQRMSNRQPWPPVEEEPESSQRMLDEILHPARYEINPPGEQT